VVAVPATLEVTLRTGVSAVTVYVSTGAVLASAAAAVAVA
jgi:hypothetical protein